MLQPWPSQKGQEKTIDNINGEPVTYFVEDEIQRLQGDDGEKLLVLQLIRWKNDERTELRLAYWMIGKNGRMKGRWTFGQFATMIPPEDLVRLIEEARRRRWIDLSI